MSFSETIILLLFILAVYPYLLYPLILSLISRFKKQNLERDISNRNLPFVSVLIAAYNEEDYIKDCVLSLIHSNYPVEKLEIIVGSDGSTDNTNHIVKTLSNDFRYVKLLECERGGKNNTINKLVTKASNDVYFFIDADCTVKKNTIKKAVEKLNDIHKLIICPIEVQKDAENSGEVGESFYQKYESYIRDKESEIDTCINALGSYAIEAKNFKLIPNNKLCDDFFSLLNVINDGSKVYFDKNNSIRDLRGKTLKEEFNRRKRLVGGGLSTLFYFKGLLRPKSGITSFFLWSHKLLRWFSSLLFLIIYLMSFFTITTLIGKIVFITFSIILIVALIGFIFEIKKKYNPFKIPLFFISMNIGFIQGIFQFIRGNQNSIWNRSGLEE